MYVDDKKLAGKKQNLDPMWKLLNKEVDLGEPTSFLDHVYLGCTQRQCEKAKTLWTVSEPRSNREFQRGEKKNCHSLQKSSFFFMVLMIWRVMQRSVWIDIVSWQTRRIKLYKGINKSTKYLIPASMTTTSKKKK